MAKKRAVEAYFVAETHKGLEIAVVDGIATERQVKLTASNSGSGYRRLIPIEEMDQSASEAVGRFVAARNREIAQLRDAIAQQERRLDAARVAFERWQKDHKP